MAGTTVFRQGDIGEEFFIILRGSVNVSIKDEKTEQARSQTAQSGRIDQLDTRNYSSTAAATDSPLAGLQDQANRLHD
jgi:CRP-like cAMP-binding protein